MIFIYSYSFNYVVFLRRSNVVVQVSVVLKRTVVDSDLISTTSGCHFYAESELVVSHQLMLLNSVH